MAKTYADFRINNIEKQIDVLEAKVEAVFKKLDQQGLGDIFRNAVLGGVAVQEADMVDLPVCDKADLHEIFNQAAEEMAPGVYMTGGKGNVTLNAEYFSYERRQKKAADRARALRRMFRLSAFKGNRLATALQSDIDALTSMLSAIESLKVQKAMVGLKAVA